MKHKYMFKPRKGFWFTSYLIKELIGRKDCFQTTLDLGITWVNVCVDKNTLFIEDVEIELDKVTPKREDHIVFFNKSDIYEIVRATASGYYKLKAVGLDKAPTLEINGIHMHRIVDIDPWNDAKLKVKKVGVKRGDVVLDTCLGLGYTAVNALLRGASIVYGVEIDENVLWCAEHNPWSRMLSSDSIVIFKGDVTNVINMFNDNYFDKIIHDPPRYTSSTGHLYSLEFYRELYRVLKPGGKLYHYTGEPGKYRGASIVKGIGDRLRKAGFYPVIYDRQSLGYVAVKPRT